MIKHLQCQVFGAFLFALAAIMCSESAALAQSNLGQRFQVDDSVDQLALIANATKTLKFKYDIPELVVENPDVLQATPVSPNEVLITGLKPGVSTLTVSDADQNLQMISIEVKVDTRKLELAYRNYFRDSDIKVHPLNTGVILAGHVARADQVANIMAVARDFFPTNVINQLQVNGNQNIAIKVKIYEVSRSKFRQLGIDWSFLGEEFSVVSSVSQIIQAFNPQDGIAAGDNTLAFGVMNNGNQFNAFINTLESHSIAKLLDQPILVAQNGRPAEFLSGGEVPILISAGLGTSTVEFRAFGTKLDMVPIVHGNGELTLEVRAEVSEVAEDLASADGTPGFRVRRVNTGVKMRAGHTLALAGDYRESHAGTKRGLPGLMHSPVFGPLFRTVEDDTDETELVFMITPRFISDVDPADAPRLGPGETTTPPSAHELYVDGYLEVPRCADDCPVNQGRPAFSSGGGPNLSQLGPGAAVHGGGGCLECSGGAPQFQGGGQVIPQVQLAPPVGYPGIGSNSNPAVRTAPVVNQVVQPVAFNRDLQARANGNKKQSLLQRIGISLPKPQPVGNAQAGGGFSWPQANQ